MRLFLGILLLVSVAIAYPWAAVILGVCVLSVLLIRSGTRQPAPLPAPRTRRLVSAAETTEISDRDRSTRAAWVEMHAIERAHGLPLTPRR